jgi:hypothetical protein
VRSIFEEDLDHSSLVGTVPPVPPSILLRRRKPWKVQPRIILKMTLKGPREAIAIRGYLPSLPTVDCLLVQKQ